MSSLRNVAIIAHVDHGKTTLTDAMLKQSGIFRDNQHVEERAMDSNDLEKERGITILSKCTAITYHDTKINIIDTPGHADFGGEVERILSMVDGVVLLVDAAEGPMPQTKFVLTKALARGLRPMVVINKVDRHDARTSEVLDEVFELFMALEASNEQLDFPILYGSGRDGWLSTDPAVRTENVHALFDVICRHVPAPDVVADGPFSMLASILEFNPYLGRILIGKVQSGGATVNQAVKGMDRTGELIEQGRLTKIFTFQGLDRVPANSAVAGDIIAIAGLEKTSVADTIGSMDCMAPIASLPIDPPTMSVVVGVNDSPLAGREGSKVTSRMIRDRLYTEAKTNISIRVADTAEADAYEVSGRGELQLSILLENMRREGYEMSVSRPRVLYKDENGVKHEPIEEVIIDVDEAYSGIVVEKLSLRKGEMIDMRPSGGAKVRLRFHVPSRGLIGYQNHFLTDTRGTGVMNRLFHGYEPYKGDIDGRFNGVLVSTEQGKAVAYALWNLEERGKLFVETGDELYQGMIIGEHSRDNDLDVNPLRAKQLSNIRTTSKDEAVKLTPPILMTIEKAMTYIGDDERVEITPKNIRLRKRILNPSLRKKH